MKKTLLSTSALAIILACLASAAEVEPGQKAVLTLSQLGENPETYEGTQFTFRGQFHTVGTVYNPFYSVFNSSSFINFSAWDFDAPVWHKEQFKGDFPYLFIDRRNIRLCDQFSKLQEFSRFEATGMIRSSFNRVPWIEVKSIKPLSPSMTREAIVHMARAFYHKNKGDHLSAVLELNQAFSIDIPRSAQVLIRKEEGKSLFILGSYPEAVRAFEEAIDLQGEEDRDTLFLLQEAETMMEYEEQLQEEYEEIWDEMQDMAAEEEEAWADEENEGWTEKALEENQIEQKEEIEE